LGADRDSRREDVRGEHALDADAIEAANQGGLAVIAREC
jgi:hypothetical protein